MSRETDIDLLPQELERRMAQIVRKGKIVDVQADPPRVKVQCGERVTAWLPWSVDRAAGESDWRPRQLGEQVVVVNPSGDPAQGVVIGSIHSNAGKAPSTDLEERRSITRDGCVESYNYATSTWTLSLPPKGRLVIEVQGGATRLELDAAGLRITVPEGG